IDSVTVVKVCDKRFEIRVIEETGNWLEAGGRCLQVSPGWQQLSRASYGGDSNCAARGGDRSAKDGA
ncbi:hypothetical protein A2U01_0078380, partial [Trifolium medium]|nr:hypothetical protein [Trifolium medium]